MADELARELRHGLSELGHGASEEQIASLIELAGIESLDEAVAALVAAANEAGGTDNISVILVEH